MEIANEILELIDKLTKAKENFTDFQDESTQLFQRTTYDAYHSKITSSSWRILLDESKTKWCIRNRIGFKTITKSPNDQVVLGPSNLKNLLISKNKADYTVAATILDQIAEKKYGRIK